LAVNRTARALVSLYALLCLVAGVCVPALHAADVGAAGWVTADAQQQDRRGDTPAPQPHDHQQCVICHAGHGTPALPEVPALEFRIRLISILHALRTSPVRAPEPSVSLPPSRAPPRA
jgi:cytochrome c553